MIDLEEYTTGTGQKLMVHSRERCSKAFPCIIHNPSNHCMRDWKTHWRDDRRLMERICEHGIGHPDPDDLANKPANKREMHAVHGCDGCCIKKENR